MIRTAFLSLKKDLDRAVFYWLVFAISAMFMYTFFHLSISDAVGVTFINSKNNLPVYLTVFNALICMIVIFLANDFFVKKKSGELALLLVCGGTYLDLVKFLFFQSGILMVTAIPAGFALGQLCFPVFNQVMSMASGREIVIHATPEAAQATVLVIAFEIFWCTMVNLGYAYRNSIYQLLHGEDSMTVGSPKKEKHRILKYIYPLLYFGGIPLLYACGSNTGYMMALGVLGIVGLNGCIKRFLHPFLERAVEERWSGDSSKAVYMGFFRSDLKMVEIYIILFIATTILLSTAIAGRVGDAGEMTLCLISFVMLNPLLAMSLMFRLSTEITGRRKMYHVLEKLGYLQPQLKACMRKELAVLYGFITAASLLYVLNSIAALHLQNLISTSVSAGILAAFLLPMVISVWASYMYYRKII